MCALCFATRDSVGPNDAMPSLFVSVVVVLSDSIGQRGKEIDETACCNDSLRFDPVALHRDQAKFQTAIPEAKADDRCTTHTANGLKSDRSACGIAAAHIQYPTNERIVSPEPGRDGIAGHRRHGERRHTDEHLYIPALRRVLYANCLELLRSETNEYVAIKSFFRASDHICRYATYT